MIDCIQESPGTIGYLDAGYGHSNGLAEVYLENRYGTKLNSAQSQAQGGIMASAKVDGIWPDSAADDFSSVSLVNQVCYRKSVDSTIIPLLQ